MNDFLVNIELPHSYEAETALLGALIIDDTGKVLEAVQAVQMPTGSFYDKRHRIIYTSMQQLIDAGEPIDTVTVASKLHAEGSLTDIGGVAYLSDLGGSVPSVENIDHYIKMLQEQRIRRSTIQAAKQQIASALEGVETAELAANAQQAANNLSEQTAPKQAFKPIRQVVMNVVEQLEKKFENRGEVTGIPSGFVDLDRMTAGFQRSDLIIVAARPSVGKTAFALNVAQNVAVKANEVVAVFSLEMSAEQLVQRMVNAEGNIDASAARTGYLTEEDWSKLASAAGVLGEANIHIDDTPALTVHDICTKSRQLKKEQGLGMIVIDYLQLISGRGKSDNRQQEVSEISRTLKQLARELEVPIIALSQLSRGVEQRQDKRPMMSDLRESGAIEQDADIVAFLYRDDYYNQDTEKKNIIEIIISKQRNGPVGTVELVFLKNFNKFVNYECVQSDMFVQPKVNEMQKRYGT